VLDFTSYGVKLSTATKGKTDIWEALEPESGPDKGLPDLATRGQEAQCFEYSAKSEEVKDFQEFFRWSGTGYPINY